MDLSLCAYCGCEIEGQGIQFQGRTFCGDECCEEFEMEAAARSVPKLDELEDDDVDVAELDDDGLGIGDDDDGVEKNLDDGDDFAIEPDDF